MTNLDQKIENAREFQSLELLIVEWQKQNNTYERTKFTAPHELCDLDALDSYLNDNQVGDKQNREPIRLNAYCHLEYCHTQGDNGSPILYNEFIDTNLMVTLRPHQNRAIKAMRILGQVIVPTGGGKTMIMIHHALQKFAKNEKFAHTAIIVAPRILLAQQLCNEWKHFHDDVDVMHVHSGGSSYFNTTDIDKLNKYYHKSTKICLYSRLIIVYTNMVASEVEVDVIYYDEAHNSVAKNFFLVFSTTLNCMVSIPTILLLLLSLWVLLILIKVSME